MAEFYTTRGLSFQLEELIKRGTKFVILVTPYLKFSETLYDRLQLLKEDNVELTIIYGKTELTRKQKTLLLDLHCNIYYKENLHAKCYINQDEAIIGSMNLYEFSEVNNIEMGIKLSRKNDKKAYLECLGEVETLTKQSKVIKQITSQEEKKQEKPITKEGKKRYYRDLHKQWLPKLQALVPDIKLSLIEDRIVSSDHYDARYWITNEYGLITLHLNTQKDAEELYPFVKENQVKLDKALKGYRCY
ncbi:phospholipase D family protein [Halosquirtibacter xylanolyticus]|uniref:phospholipase D family protein n=1 Tax=Halosquirtibacter xylanolyticus TaxID=3374599 RepID=UPI003748B878|nr:phospholipase D family protein [Prolixibacteraceae bacterium]